MIKAIIFDIGGVLVVPRYSKLYRYLFAGLEITLNPFLSKESRLKKYIELYRGTRHVDGRVLGIVDLLKDSGYGVHVISNTTFKDCVAIKGMDMYKHFDIVVMSSDVGVRKPDKMIYEILLNRTGLRSDECVFIDNERPNVLAAEDIGMKVVLFKNPRQLRESLESLGVRIGGKYGE